VASSAELDKTEMRRCAFSFKCDCSPEKLLPFFRALAPEALHDLYGDDEALQITCPRCGKQFPIARSDLQSQDG
jgi:redox-regulated HSP33 family molecular chaperone